MAYQVTTAASIDDVCAQVAAFAVAHAGFTLDGTYLRNGLTIRKLKKGDIYWHFGQYNLALGSSAFNVMIGMGYTGGTSWPTTAQGAEFVSYWTFNAFNGPFTNLFLFTDGENVHCIVEMTNNIFTMMSFGKQTTTDSGFVGGEYHTSNDFHYKSGSLYGAFSSPSQGNTPIWTAYSYPNSTTFTSSGYMRHCRTGVPAGNYLDFAKQWTRRNNIGWFPAGVWSYNDDLVQRSPPNAGTNRTIMLQVFNDLWDSTADLMVTVGHIPNLRFLNMHGISPKSIIYTDWQVFPISQQQGDNVNVPNSLDYAHAFKRA